MLARKRFVCRRDDLDIGTDQGIGADFMAIVAIAGGSSALDTGGPGSADHGQASGR